MRSTEERNIAKLSRTLSYNNHIPSYWLSWKLIIETWLLIFKSMVEKLYTPQQSIFFQHSATLKWILGKFVLGRLHFIIN